ncbi:sulfite exporter TauE/SafE family protein [Sorangium sp. So ce590]|uniref:sulfite exporter TauE/SafE family protein n=1 Tax=Sorangium sp. So ce590 TaxID=3133317 RepID=UPI003F63FCF2
MAAAYLIATLGVCIGVTAGLLGAGPSILTVLLLTRVAGLELDRAIATSLLVVALMSAIAVIPYARAGAVAWRAALGVGLASMTGAFLGGRISALIPQEVLLMIFLLATVVAAVAMLGKRPPLPLDPGGSRPRGQSMAVLATGGLLVGGLTGLVGLGGGFAIVPLLVVVVRTPMRAAIGTSILVIAMNTLAGLAGHLPHPSIEWRIATYLAVAECAGSVAGARLSTRVSAEALRRAFGGIMLAAAAFMLGRLVLR